MTLTKKILIYTSGTLFSLGLLGAAGCGTPEKQNTDIKTDSVVTYNIPRIDTTADTTSNQEIYTCKFCNLSYKEKEWVDKCEDFCREYKSCSIDITKHAIQLENKNE